MAETAVSFVVDKLVTMLVEETTLLEGVHREVADIKDELESIQSFLKDADARADKGAMNEGVKTWVKQVREIAYRIEDVLDEYMLREAQRRYLRGFTGFLDQFNRKIKKLKMGHEIASEIQDIKRSIREVKERRITYGFDSSVQVSNINTSPRHDPRVVTSLFIEEAEIVGIESPRQELISFLVGGGFRRSVISVLGMDGLGKTTLAKKVYDHQKVTSHFDCRAWISVSQSYRMEELLRSMIIQFCNERRESTPKGIDTLDEIQLIGKVREYLQQKRYVVVFDDVWTIDFWKTIKHALLDNNKGSRVIVTTRIDDVASSCKESLCDRFHKLQPLSEESAWKLFCNKAFQSDFGGYCPLELIELPLQIVRRCEGLPLAIVAIGGLLSTTKKDVSQWKKLYNSLGSELESNPHLTGITRILSLSYYALPYYLKPCFLYFGLFLEDYSIKCMKLIRLWIAENFVKIKRGKTLEQVGEDYLTELIHRSLVQVSRVDCEGRVRSCRVHDLLREIILSKSEELSFHQAVANEDLKHNGNVRRLSIQNNTDYIVEYIGNSPIRSVLLFVVDELPKSLMSTVFTNFKLLKVLDFENAPLNFVPEEVGNLFHLRYFGLRGTMIKMLPKSIGKLHNLQTLDLKQSLVHELPTEIYLLHNLRYLRAFYFDLKTAYNFNSIQGVKMWEEGVGCLEALHKLYHVKANHGMSFITELGKLRQLRKLSIQNLTREQGKVLCTSIEKMNHLESLEVHSASPNEILDIQHVSSPPPSLRRLYLHGQLAKLPNWIAKLQNLVRLYFEWTGFTNDPLKALEALPNLLELELRGAYDGEQLYFEEGGFQKLKVLRLYDLQGLKNVIIDKGALLLLEVLYIGPCLQLEKVPFGIQHLRKLTTLEFLDMPKEFVYQLNPDGGKLCGIVEHVSSVFISFFCEGQGYVSNPLREFDIILKHL